MTNLLWSIGKNSLGTYDDIQKIAIGQGDDYTTDRLLDYNNFNKYNKIIAIDLPKQQERKLIQKQYKKLILQEI